MARLACCMGQEKREGGAAVSGEPVEDRIAACDGFGVIALRFFPPPPPPSVPVPGLCAGDCEGGHVGEADGSPASV